MISQVRYELKKVLLSYEFWIAFLLSVFLVNASFIYGALTNSGRDILYSKSPEEFYIGSAYNTFWNLYAGIWPFLIVLSAATSFIKEKKYYCLGTGLYRSTYRNFIYAKVIAAAIGSMIVIGIPMFLNLLQSYLIFPHTKNVSYAVYPLMDYDRFLLSGTHMYQIGGKGFPLLGLYLRSPFLYTSLFMLTFVLFTGVCSAFVMSLSFHFSRSRILLFLPIYAIVFISSKAKQIFFEKVLSEVASFPIGSSTQFPVNTTKYFDLYLMDYFSILGADARLPWLIPGIVLILIGITVFCSEKAVIRQWALIQ